MAVSSKRVARPTLAPHFQYEKAGDVDTNLQVVRPPPRVEVAVGVARASANRSSGRLRCRHRRELDRCGPQVASRWPAGGGSPADRLLETFKRSADVRRAREVAV